MTDADGDPWGSFESWARARQHDLLRAAWLVSGDLQRAEDLVQEALFKVSMRWQRLRSENPDAYARTVIYRDHISWWRRHRETPVHDVHIVEGVADDDVRERPLIVRDALARLTQKQRAVLVLRYFDDLTEAQAAAVLGVTVGTVKKQAAVAQQRLRELAPELGELLGHPEEGSG